MERGGPRATTWHEKYVRDSTNIYHLTVNVKYMAWFVTVAFCTCLIFLDQFGACSRTPCCSPLHNRLPRCKSKMVRMSSRWSFTVWRATLIYLEMCWTGLSLTKYEGAEGANSWDVLRQILFHLTVTPVATGLLLQATHLEGWIQNLQIHRPSPETRTINCVSILAETNTPLMLGPSS